MGHGAGAQADRGVGSAARLLGMQFLHDVAEKHVAADQETIERATKSLKENQDEVAKLAQAVLQAGLEIAKLEQ